MQAQEQTQEVQRIITPHDREVAKRLKSIYARKRNILHLTQNKLGEVTGYSQPTISCHMTGRVALRGVRGIMAYANALEVDPRDIDPRFRTRYLRVDPQDMLPLQVTDLEGRTKNVVPRTLSGTSPSRRGFVLKSEYTPLLPKGTLVITDKDLPLETGKTVIIEIDGYHALARVHEITQRSLTYSLPWGYDACRDQVIRNRGVDREKLERFYSATPVKIALSVVGYIAPVLALELP